MITKNYNVHVDFNGGVQYTPITFVQNDFGTGSLTYDIEQAIGDARVVTTFRIPGGASFAIQATKTDEHTAVLNMPATALTSQGIVDCQVALYEDGVRLTNIVSYEITVQADLSGEVTVDPEEYTIIQQLLAEIDGLQDAEDLRVLNEGAEDPPSGRVGAELAREAAEEAREAAEGARGVAYLAAEGDRNTAYGTAEGLRNTAYETAEGLRDTAYGAQEGVRDGQYSGAEAARDADYDTAEGVRGGQYTTAEGLRDTAYETQEGVRDGQYSTAEGERDSDYSAQESVRDGLYSAAESGRDSAYNAQELVRDGLYDTAEGVRDAAYSAAEGARDDLYDAAEALRESSENARLVFETYNSATAYVVGNKVAYNDCAYVCIQNGTNKTPGIETTYWLLIASGAPITITRW